MQRVILHVDLDSFYASLEEKRKPEIKGKPVVNCMMSGRSAESGAVATANYKARELGIKAGMAIFQAKRKSDAETVFLPVDLEFYRSESGKIMEVMENYADSFQQVSIDEAYLDLSSGDYKKAEEIAKNMKEDVHKQFDITCSVGIAPNKLVAKMASRHKKPDGLTIITPEQVNNFLSPLPVGKLHGVGGKTVAILEELGIKLIDDLKKSDFAQLEHIFGKNRAKLLLEKARGEDESPVTEQIAKQLSRIGTLKKDTSSFEEIFALIEHLSREMHKKILKREVRFKTVSIIIIDSHLETITRSKTIKETNALEEILENARLLLKEFLDDNELPIRRAGIRVSNLSYGQEKQGLMRFFK